MCGPKFCSMSISQELLHLAQQPQQALPAAADGAEQAAAEPLAKGEDAAGAEGSAQAGMQRMSQQFKQMGAQLYH